MSDEKPLQFKDNFAELWDKYQNEFRNKLQGCCVDIIVSMYEKLEIDDPLLASDIMQVLLNDEIDELIKTNEKYRELLKNLTPKGEDNASEPKDVGKAD